MEVNTSICYNAFIIPTVARTCVTLFKNIELKYGSKDELINTAFITCENISFSLSTIIEQTFSGEAVTYYNTNHLGSEEMKDDFSLFREIYETITAESALLDQILTLKFDVHAMLPHSLHPYGIHSNSACGVV